MRANSQSGKREHVAWGRISPKMTMTMVEVKKPTRPLVTSAMRMERAEFTATLPRSSVHRRRLPRLRMGMMRWASRRLSGEPDSATICGQRQRKPGGGKGAVAGHMTGAARAHGMGWLGSHRGLPGVLRGRAEHLRQPRGGARKRASLRLPHRKLIGVQAEQAKGEAGERPREADQHDDGDPAEDLEAYVRLRRLQGAPVAQRLTIAAGPFSSR